MPGLIIVEDLLTTVIKNGLKYLQTNPNIVDDLFANSLQVTRDRLKQYLTSNSINVMRGFPTPSTVLPTYAIMLGNDEEATPVIGNYMGDDDDDFTAVSTNGSCNVMYHEGGYYIQAPILPIVDVTQITYNGVSYMSEFTILDYDRGIIELEFPVDFSKATTCGITFDYKSEGNEKYGSLFNTQYRIETWTNNGDLTVLLYYVLKWIFLNSRDQLTTEGIPLQKISGGELESPPPDYMPEFVWRRGLVLSCNDVEQSYDVAYDFIQGIDINYNAGS